MPAPSDFVSQVRHALTHLYDPDVLRAHPLVGLLHLDAHINAQSALRETLLAAIEALKPAPTAPVESRVWRVYKMLQCRYVQQLSQEQTAHQLGIGLRHVRREQRVAVQALADLLYQRCGAPAEMARQEEVAADLGADLAWLKAAGQGEPADVAEAFQAALRLIAPLAAARHVGLEMAPPPRLPPAAIHPAALRQAIVSAASYLIRRAAQGRLRLRATQRGREICVQLAAQAPHLLAPEDEDAVASLRTVQTLLSTGGGRLERAETAKTLALTLSAPAVDVVDVLLLDDNADIHQLFSRYLAETRYRLRSGAVERLWELVAEQRPQVILLDVMMPGVDGWELLGRLRQHPLTGALPIIVCTILPERDLALSLGATDFLPKPISRQALLAALSRALGEMPPEPR